jgi:TetR/AcrR family transcriptional regulator, regulator of cefoperazone and chloramphenicol sensitivity
MRTPKQDRTSRAIIRDEALRLFAAQGVDSITVRQIASAASVSPALVIRHFGSKDGLRSEVDRHVLRTFDAMLGELTRQDAAALYDPAGARSFVDAVVQHLPADSPLPRYLTRLLLERSQAGRRLFRRIFKIGQTTLQAMVEAGLAAPGTDPNVRAAFLTANDLAVILLRDQLAAVLGFDPLSRQGMSRWGAEVLAVYSSGLGTSKGSNHE